MQGIKNKKHLCNTRGVTLIEVMIVLAISGVLIIAAIGTFTARSGVVFNASIDSVASDLRTVASETRNGLGPSGSGTNCASTSETCQLKATDPIPTGSAIYGEAVEFSNDHCPGSTAPTSCMIVYKLMRSTSPGVTTVVPYERYVITLPTNLEFSLPAATNPLVAYTNTGEVFSFNIPTGSVVGFGSPLTTVATKFSTSGAATSTNYTALNKTVPNIRVRDRANTNMQARLNIDMSTPINITVERDAP